MTALYMISLPVKLATLHETAARRGLNRVKRGSVIHDEGQVLHHVLAETFGKGVLQPFRLMPARHAAARTANLYAYSSLEKQALRERAADFALPETGSIFDLTRLDTKAMPDTWREGKRLGFDVRIRPVRRLKHDLAGWSREAHRATLNGETAKPIKAGSELDVFVAERLRAFPEGPPDASAGKAAATREQIYADWLAERLRGAAELIGARTRMARYRRVVIIRNGVLVEGPDVVFHGELSIADGDRFRHKLATGLGRQNAYGYGMLLLRPPAPES